MAFTHVLPEAIWPIIFNYVSNIPTLFSNTLYDKPINPYHRDIYYISNGIQLDLVVAGAPTRALYKLGLVACQSGQLMTLQLLAARPDWQWDGNYWNQIESSYIGKLISFA